MKTCVTPSIATTFATGNLLQKIVLSFFIFIFVLLNARLNAQSKPAPLFQGHHKNIYMEFLGSSILTGVHFDMRLKKGRMDGIGFRAGIGGFSVNGTDSETNTEISGGIVTLPIEFNHLVGKRRSSFETGIGILPVYATVSGIGELTDYQYIRGEGFGIAGGYLTLGYRLQPLKTGFMLQVHWNPMILRGSGFEAGWFGIGLGVGFK